MKASARIAGVLSGAVLGFGLIAGLAPLAHADGEQKHASESPGSQRSDVDTSDWPQGKSLSDPDGGLWDKPGEGDRDGDDDRDGNNGCGNDDDRSDDNNGNGCGREAGGAEVRGDTDVADDACDAGDHGAEVKNVATAGGGDDHGAKVSAVAKANDTADDSDCPETDDSVSAAGTSTKLKTTAGVSAAGTPGATVLGATEVAPTDTSTTPTVTPGTAQVMGISETAPSAAPSALARTGAGLGALAALGGLCLGGGRLTALIRRRLSS